MDRGGRTLLQREGESLRSFAGELRIDESDESAVLRIVREALGVELQEEQSFPAHEDAVFAVPLFTKLLEQDEESWYLVALDSWPPLREDIVLIDSEEALRSNLEYSTRYVLEWFSSPSEAFVHPPSREAAEA